MVTIREWLRGSALRAEILQIKTNHTNLNFSAAPRPGMNMNGHELIMNLSEIFWPLRDQFGVAFGEKSHKSKQI